MNPRYKERIRSKFPVIFTDGTMVGEGWVLDLTIPGCLIESARAVEEGEALKLKLFLPGFTSPLVVGLGVVRWAKNGKLGVEFIRMDEVQGHALNIFMAQHLPAMAPLRGEKRSFSGPAAGRNWHLETYVLGSQARQ